MFMFFQVFCLELFTGVHTLLETEGDKFAGPISLYSIFSLYFFHTNITLIYMQRSLLLGCMHQLL